MSIQLIDCPACGSKVSSQAVACPHCGQPLRSVLKPVAEPHSDGGETNNARILSILSICLVVVAFFGFGTFGILFLIAAIILGRIAVAKGDQLGNVGSILGGIVLGVLALVLLINWIELSGGIKENIKLIGVLLFAIVAIVTLCIEGKKKREARRR